jgi:hypothetical protein
MHSNVGGTEGDRSQAFGLQTQRLIERARLVQQSLECREQAARYRAQAACLAEAIALAEIGDQTKLQALLGSWSHDPIELTPVPLVTQNPWASMLQGASRRACHPAKSNDPLGDCNEKSTQIDFDSGRSVNTDAAPLETNSQAQQPRPTRLTSSAKDPFMATPSLASLSLASPEKSTPEKASAVKPSAVKPSTVKTSAVKTSAVKTSAVKTSVETGARGPTPLGLRKRKLAKYRLDLWISLAVHGVMLGILAVCVVVTVHNTPVLSVVASTVESNEVLMETPMESISELDSTSVDTANLSSPDTSQIKIQVDTDAISVDQVDLGIEAVAQSSSISQQMTKAGAPGNKVTQGAEFFGSKAVGNRFVYIIDASPSMRRDRAFDAAKEEILRSLRSMQSKQRFALLFFGGQVETLELEPGQKIDQPVSATPENIEKSVQWLRKITIQKDGKPPIEAVKSALELQPDGIFLLFDGDTKLDNWTQVVRKLNTSEGLLSDGGTQVPIHVIHFFRDEFQRSMQLLAHENGGTYRFVPRPQNRILP